MALQSLTSPTDNNTLVASVVRDGERCSCLGELQVWAGEFQIWGLKSKASSWRFSLDCWPPTHPRLRWAVPCLLSCNPLRQSLTSPLVEETQPECIGFGGRHQTLWLLHSFTRPALPSCSLFKNPQNTFIREAGSCQDGSLQPTSSVNRLHYSCPFPFSFPSHLSSFGFGTRDRDRAFHDTFCPQREPPERASLSNLPSRICAKLANKRTFCLN